MPDGVSNCPLLCGWEAQVAQVGDADRVKCELCGEFTITRTLSSTALAERESGEVESLLPYLRAYIRQANQRGEIVSLNTSNWKDLALPHKYTPTSRKITKLLEFVASLSKPGFTVQINPAAEAPLVDATSTTEMRYLLRHLVSIGYLDEQAGGNYLVSVNGWKQIEGAGLFGIPGKCFVAMSFHDSLNEAYENGIFLAVKADCKMEPVRVDRVHHNDKICDKIIAEIRTCQFLVSDVTLQRAGVYFEAGFAMGLGRPVIWTCRDDDLKNVHFDTRQYNHIVWKEPADLRTQLSDRIKATIPGAV